MKSALVISLLFLSGLAHAEQAHALPLGRLVLVGQLAEDAALRGAKEAGGARWSAITLKPRKEAAVVAPHAELERLRALYLEADFLGCLARMQRSALAPDDLLARGLRNAAAKAAILGAACAHDAGDADLAKRLLTRVFEAELPTDALKDAKPVVQKMMEGIQLVGQKAARHGLVLKTLPKEAHVTIDGSPRPCPRSPCRSALRSGRHVIVFSKLGYLSRRLIIDLDQDQQRKVSLDPAPAEKALSQLSAYLAEGEALDGVEVGATAADAFRARVVVLVQSRRRRLAASLYDRKLGRIVARAGLSEEPGVLEKAVRMVIEEWRTKVEPTPLWKRPLFWGITVGAAAATALTVFFITRPTEKRYVLEVPAQ
ncbi:MAG: PEGA domain-containing protein [Deltaproteobacteria bacterium]|nr:PEGA domain-containing protein [Deltaproteobacteria bacterium]